MDFKVLLTYVMYDKVVATASLNSIFYVLLSQKIMNDNFFLYYCSVNYNYDAISLPFKIL